MSVTRLAVLPLAAALACTFDGTGLLSAGPPDGSSSSPGSTGTAPGTTGATPDSTGNDSGTSLTTDPLNSTGVEPTTDPSIGTSTGVEPGTTGGTTGGAVCGDGVKEGDEACDAADLADQTCATLGFPGGTLACAPNCAFDVAGCDPLSTCGDGNLDAGEDCDDDLGGETCKSQGYDFGDLACTNCAFDTSACGGVPDNWYDIKYLKRRKLTIAKAKLKGVLDDFPVVMAITDEQVLSGLAPAGKVAFATGTKSLLSHELELAEDDRVVFWVELDLDDTQDEVFYVYYGNPDPLAPDTEKPADTWSNGFLGVWHLDEMVPDEMNSGKHADATASGHDGTQSDNEGVDTDCPIGACQQIGNQDFIDLAEPADFKLGNANATIALWFRGDMQANCSLFARSDPMMSAEGHLIFGALDDGRLSFEQLGAGKLDANSVVVDAKWHHLVWTQTKDVMNGQERWLLYVDGTEVQSGLFTGKPAADGHAARLGGPTVGSTYPDNCNGRYDEVQISTAARSVEWILTAHENQSAPTTFVAVGPEEFIF